MNESEYYYSRNSYEVRNADIQQEAAMNRLLEAQEYNLFNLLKPALYRDGNMWCCLLGENIQEGVVGFGDTPYLAILSFNKAMQSK